MKVLSTANAGDVERRRRFVQEAQAASALNHPNIITIHDVVSMEGFEFMVMEFVSGVTLDDLIPKHGLDVQKCLDISVQMADALQTAHAAGIVHRDLKPATERHGHRYARLVKILDFGIAKLAGPTPAAASNTDETLPIDSPMTIEGSILGTVCYMSPEQAQAKPVDQRSDIFSFGLVLYEMLTGQKAFSGDSALSTLSSILRDEAKPISQLVQGVPPELEQIVNRAIRKEPDQRWQSMQELRRGPAAAGSRRPGPGMLRTQLGATAIVPLKNKSSMLPIAVGVGALVVVAAAGGGFWWMKHRQSPQPPPVVAEAPPAASHAAGAVDATPAAAPVDNGMTNDEVLGLIANKVAPGTIINQIRSAAKTNFDLSTAGVIALSQGGVPANIIEVMRNPKAVAPVATIGVAPPRPSTSSPPPATKSSSTFIQSQPVEPTPAPAAVPVAPPPAPVQPAPAPVAAAAPVHINTVQIPDGKPFNITLSQDASAKLTAGQKISLRDYPRCEKIGDIVIIAKGTPVSGEIVDPGDSKKTLGIIKTQGKATFKLTSVESAGASKLGHSHHSRA